MRKNKRRDDDDTEVDMTPMLDIVFIMLIFFIVTTSFVKESGIDINRPKPDKSEQESNIRPILIAIDENSEITMGSQIVDVDAIIARVQVARAQRPKAGIVVMAHADAYSGLVVRAVDSAKLAGGGTITVVREPK